MNIIKLPFIKYALLITYLLIGLIVYFRYFHVEFEDHRHLKGVEHPITLEPMGKNTKFFDRQLITVGKREYTYFWHEPELPWPRGALFPLVMTLHNARGYSFAPKYLIQNSIKLNYPTFIFVPLISAKRNWARPSFDNNDTLSKQYALGDMVEAIKELSAIYPIDKNRIYVTGCFDGGTGVYGAARYFPDFFAAGVAFGGRWNSSQYKDMLKMPLFIKDREGRNTASTELAYSLYHSGATVRYQRSSDLSDFYHPSCPFSDDVWQWMFGHTLKNE